MIELAWLVPLPFLVAFPIILFFGKKTWNSGAGIAILSAAISFVLAILVSFDVFAGKTYEMTYTLINLYTYDIGVGILVDPLSTIMILVVTLISLLVNVYSLGYMHGEEGLPRYYAELMLFSGSMLTLVLADSLLLLYIGWELVGLSSYLLIGFWYKKPEAASAAKKAFITTKTGDAFMLIGIAMLFMYFHTLNIPYINEHAGELNTIQAIFFGTQVAVLSLIGIFLFFGAIGKSAQIPLLGWLWDAMEGPTTVSCLIHSATMVKAGIYLVARMYPTFATSSVAMTFIAYVGALTAFVAATMALASYGIKKILAFSTISQLGYMVLGLGVGGLGPAMYHLVSHAFFKALLFLGAGSVIHAVHTRDIREMGGLHNSMKITSLTMLIGGLSLSGIPPFSGFFSKDLVIEAAYHSGDMFLYWLSVITAGLTAFYFFRMWYMVFIKKPQHEIHAHESPPVMTYPMIVLAALTTIFGLFVEATNSFIPFTVKTFEDLHLEFTELGILHMEILKLVSVPLIVPETLIPFVPISLAALGVLLASGVYYKPMIPPDALTRNPVGKWIFTLLYNRYYVDDIYNFVAEQIFLNGFGRALSWFDLHVIDKIVEGIAIVTVLVAKISRWFDEKVVDGIVNGIASSLNYIGSKVRKIQSGIIQNYVTLILIGLFFLLLIMNFYNNLVEMIKFIPIF
ncbi:MAG: NADH-quinone oxidoreductase subunit L [Candidatus Asgardarchaeia archaeon]